MRHAVKIVENKRYRQMLSTQVCTGGAKFAPRSSTPVFGNLRSGYDVTKLHSMGMGWPSRSGTSCSGCAGRPFAGATA